MNHQQNVPDVDITHTIMMMKAMNRAEREIITGEQLIEIIASWFSKNYGWNKVDDHERRAARRLLNDLELTSGIYLMGVRYAQGSSENEGGTSPPASSSGKSNPLSPQLRCIQSNPQK
jgi:hypothetical protein